MTPNVPKGRLLVVDDEPLICAVLAEGLSREGFECRTAAGGEEALKILEREQFDALISDLRMPGMSGLALLEAVRPKYPRLSFLVATAVDNVHVGVAAMKRGAADYLLKPLHLDAVAVAVERALERKRLELEVEAYRNHLEEMVRERTKQLRRALQQIEQTYDDTLQALGAALDLRDAETEGHSRRVSLYCLEVARLFECPGDELLQIVRGSYLHDIGKIGVPDAILRKPGNLTSAEVAIMRTHVPIGSDLVNRIPFLAPAGELVSTHHETYDGTGYPRGLRGAQIPLGARVFAVVDALDAMTSDRPYRRALPMATAREEIARESGQQFDPEVVEAFFAIPTEAWGNIRLQVAHERTRVHTSLSKGIESLAFSLNQIPLMPCPGEGSGEGEHRARCGGSDSILEELTCFATLAEA